MFIKHHYTCSLLYNLNQRFKNERQQTIRKTQKHRLNGSKRNITGNGKTILKNNLTNGRTITVMKSMT